jgi:hypothetical protein
MHDLTIELDNRPGALAAMGEALGAAGVSVEGGGMFVVDGRAVAHFLFADGDAARTALQAAGITVTAVRTPLVQRLDQQTPGQLGAITRLMAEAGVNIEVLYSDHDNQLILVVDQPEAGTAVSANWTRRRASTNAADSPDPTTQFGAGVVHQASRAECTYGFSPPLAPLDFVDLQRNTRSCA